MSYRPEGWENPYEQKLQANGYWSNAGFSENYDCFEAGADAILEALRGKGIRADTIRDLRYPETETLTIPTIERMKEMREIKGEWVFIPDEEKR